MSERRQCTTCHTNNLEYERVRRRTRRYLCAKCGARAEHYTVTSGLGAMFLGFVVAPILAMVRGYSLATLPIGFYFAVCALGGIGLYCVFTRQRFLKEHPISN